MNRQNELKLFYNDIKYVTRSLKKDSEALCCLIASNTKQYKLREPREIEAFMKDEEKRLSELKQIVHQLRKMAKRGKQKFHIKEWKSFKELDDLLESNLGISEELKPSALWFKLSNYDEICDMLDEAQTKTEDTIKSRKRIFKVWSEDVLLAHNVRFTIEYVDMLGKSSKYFNTNFWKYRKILKNLFIEDESLYSDEEIKLLKKNVATMTENDNWLFFKKRRITEVLGENYIGKETDFNQIRKNYDKFYSWLLKQPEESQITLENFPEYCEYVRELQKTEYMDYFQKLHEFIPFFNSDIVYNMEFAKLEQQIMDYRNALKVIHNQYGISYFEEVKEVSTFDKWNKLIQRVLDKENWLKEKKKDIDDVFGESYEGISTNWEKMKDCILESSIEINGIPERRIKRYGFMIKEIEEPNETFKSIDEAINWILERETSVAVSDIIKRCSKMLGQKRITVKLKKEIEEFIQTSLPEGYCMDGDFVVVSDNGKLNFYIAADKEKRDIETVSNQEMMFGIMQVIKVEEEMTLDNLTKLFSKLLGYPRRTKNLQLHVENAVKQLKNNGKIVRKSGGWTLLKN